MACTDDRSEQIARVAGGRIDADSAADLFAHLDACAVCSGEFDLAADLVRVATPGTETSGSPAIRSERPAVARPSGIPIWAGLVAAALLLGSVSLLFWWPEDRVARERRELQQLAQTTPFQVSQDPLRSGSPGRSAAFGDGMKAYASGDFEAASRHLAEHLSERERDPLAQLYLGIAWLQISRLDEAIAALRAAADGGKDLLQERALWYWANAELLRGDRDAAVRVLSRLAALNGDYQPNAEQLTESISRSLR